MDAFRILKEHGKISIFALIKEIHKSEYDHVMLEYIRHCMVNETQFVIHDDNKVELMCQGDNGYFYYLTTIFKNNNKEIESMTLESFEPNWEE